MLRGKWLFECRNLDLVLGLGATEEEARTIGEQTAAAMPYEKLHKQCVKAPEGYEYEARFLRGRLRGVLVPQEAT